MREPPHDNQSNTQTRIHNLSERRAGFSFRHRIILDGQLVQLQPEQRIIDGAEMFAAEVNRANNGEIEVVQPTELGESLKQLNNDEIQTGTRMSGIDMRANLHYSEISSILAVDTLVNFRFLPSNAIPFTRQKKRLSVSLKGKGRDDIVAIVGGKKEQDAKMGGGGLFDKMRGLVGGGDKQ